MSCSRTSGDKWITYRTAAQPDDAERLKGSGNSDNPGESDENEDAENILDAREIDAEEDAELSLRLALKSQKGVDFKTKKVILLR